MADSGGKNDDAGLTFAQGAKIFFGTMIASSLVIWSAGLIGWWLGGRYPLPKFLAAIFGG